MPSEPIKGPPSSMTTGVQDPELQGLYAQFGRVAEMAQVMELEAGNLALTFALVAFDPDNLKHDERQFLKAVSDDIDRRTFGNLTRLLKKTLRFDDTIELAIDSALENRNYLAHRFFRSHNFAINTREGRAKMAEELERLYATFSQTHAILQGLTHTLNKAFGNTNVTEGHAIQMMEAGKRVEI